jgi:hypothetical protein
MAPRSEQSAILSQQLLLSVAEELKWPLLQIARRAELGQTSADFASIQTAADSALQLLDNYALSVRLQLAPQTFELEPVSVSSVLYDAGQRLNGLARFYGVDLELSIAGRYEPVMAHRAGLEAALVSLGTSLIEALPARGSSQLKLQLATHRCRYGIVAGLYSDDPKLTTQNLAIGRGLQVANSRQPLPTLTHTAGAGIFVADTLFSAMRLRLTASRHNRLYGLGAVLPPTNQLQLV